MSKPIEKTLIKNQETMKVYDTEPDGNEMAKLEPARYFNLAIEQIEKITELMETSHDNVQPLLVHLDMFVYLSKKYTEMAARRATRINIEQVASVFNAWFERNEKNITVKYREGIKESAKQLFQELYALK